MLSIRLYPKDSGLAQKGYICWRSQNNNKAKQTLETGIRNGEAKCAYYYAVIMEQEGDVENSEILFENAFSPIKEEADKGDSEACAIIGSYYECGIIESANEELAEYYFKKGVHLGGDYATFRYGKSIFRGTYSNIEDCEKEGIKMMQSAASNNSEYAYELGLFILSNKYEIREIFPNYKEVALYYLKKAADADHDGACYLLGALFGEGKQYPKDFNLAYQYSQKARILGHEQAEKLEKSFSVARKLSGWFSSPKKKSFSELIPEMQEVMPEYAGMFEQVGKAQQTVSEFDQINELSKSSDIKDKKQAVERLEQIIADNPLYEQTHGKLLDRLYGEISESVADDDVVDVKWLLKAEERGNKKARFLLGVCYYEGRGIEQDYYKALSCFRRSIDCGTEEGLSYFYLANCYAFGYGLLIDAKKAKEYYGKAMEYGVNCKYAMDSIEYHTPGHVTKDGMREYAERVLRDTQNATGIYYAVQKDIAESFGCLWDKLPGNAKVSMVTGINAYISFYAMGKEVTAGGDFSIVINSICKALEIVLAKIFFTDYISYLKTTDLDVKTIKGLRNYAVKSIDGGFQYPNESDISLFSLGGARHILDVQGVKQFLEDGDTPPILQYAEEIFRKDAFPKEARGKAIAQYLISLADEVLTIKEYRNPAAHGKIMTSKDAEVCADTLVLVKKMIMELLKKVE